MAAVFDATTKVKRRVPDPMTDDTLAPAGSLNWRAITTETALAGAEGVDCKRVTGQRWELIRDGDE